MSEVREREHVGVVKKNATQEIRISVGDYGPATYIYVLVCPNGHPLDAETDRHPGLTIRAHTLRPLIPLLEQALELAEAREMMMKDSPRMNEGKRRRR